MQTQGGGKHDILPVARATATTLDCMWMMPRDPDADMCPGAPVRPVSTEQCMAHQSYVPLVGSTNESNRGARCGTQSECRV
jgi:hypothetical protein